ncbi:hypothetical protein H105_06186 [Trichophyton soudanense CBS 452.61]|uniref:Uncharacterized protein n=1 Tax=Trichophyton soudanense CBS 452.61 TaxID=1215331 RepID=A0A022XLT7_TRISD|nr:hypothetical protein H105_06186 [Trichophyton soudanense CBS 452.61]EZG04367.1 hypothetical protein H106_06009 [Trichophyton rubrum CBS 735.88]
MPRRVTPSNHRRAGDSNPIGTPLSRKQQRDLLRRQQEFPLAEEEEPFQAGMTLRFVPENARIRLNPAKGWDIQGDTPAEPPVKLTVPRELTRIKVGIATDEAKPTRRQISKYGDHREIYPKNEPVYIRARPAYPYWEYASSTGNHIAASHVRLDSAFNSADKCTAAMDLLRAKKKAWEEAEDLRYSNEMRSWRIQQCEWEIKVLETEWSRGNIIIFHPDTTREIIDTAKEHLQIQINKDIQGLVDTAFIGRLPSTIIRTPIHGRNPPQSDKLLRTLQPLLEGDRRHGTVTKQNTRKRARPQTNSDSEPTERSGSSEDLDTESSKRKECANEQRLCNSNIDSNSKYPSQAMSLPEERNSLPNTEVVFFANQQDGCIDINIDGSPSSIVPSGASETPDHTCRPQCNFAINNLKLGSPALSTVTFDIPPEKASFPFKGLDAGYKRIENMASCYHRVSIDEPSPSFKASRERSKRKDQASTQISEELKPAQYSHGFKTMEHIHDNNFPPSDSDVDANSNVPLISIPRSLIPFYKDKRDRGVTPDNPGMKELMETIAMADGRPKKVAIRHLLQRRGSYSELEWKHLWTLPITYIEGYLYCKDLGITTDGFTMHGVEDIIQKPEKIWIKKLNSEEKEYYRQMRGLMIWENRYWLFKIDPEKLNPPSGKQWYDRAIYIADNGGYWARHKNDILHPWEVAFLTDEMEEPENQRLYRGIRVKKRVLKDRVKLAWPSLWTEELPRIIEQYFLEEDWRPVRRE